MSNKGLDIVYAFNDLPVEMRNSKGKVINYYTSTGIKLKSVMEPDPDLPGTSEPIVTNYFEGQEFINSKLNSIYFEEGRATYEEFPETEDDEEYIEYFLKDHLGNTRVRIADKNGDGKIKYDVNDPANDELMSKHHYYPFGLEWDVPNFDVNGNSLLGTGDKTKYTYNGKEWIDDLNIKLSDYGARYYDPAIGRWTSIDPASEEYVSISGYAYVYNNPLIFVDPTGAYIEFANEEAMRLYNIIYKNASKERRAILDRIDESEVVYRINVGKTQEGYAGQTQIGENQDCKPLVLDIIINSDSNENEQIYSLGDELEHARQFEDGEISYITTFETEGRKITGSFEGSGDSYDFVDEAKSKDAGLEALESIIKVVPDKDGNNAQKWKNAKLNGSTKTYLNEKYGVLNGRNSARSAADYDANNHKKGNVFRIVYKENGKVKTKFNPNLRPKKR